MPKFCPNCGMKLEFANAKFCPECGNPLIPSNIIPQQQTAVKKEPVKEIEIQYATDNDIEASNLPIVSSINELGERLEKNMELFFQGQGYKTKKNEWFGRELNRPYEIDIIAQKNQQRFAIECKNYSKPVGIEKLNHFAQKLRWLRDDTNENWHGIFIAFNDVSSGAEQIAGENNIETWGHDEIVEKWAQFSFGRMSVKGENINLESALKINSDYLKVTSLDIKNKEKISVIDATLTFHPYLRVAYNFASRFTDPSRETHNFQDKGTVVVDMIDGKVLNPPIIRDVIDGLAKVVKIISGSKATDESNRAKKIVHEIIHSQPSLEYSLTIGQDYNVSKLDKVIPTNNAISAALDYIIEKNSRTITYSIRKRKDTFDQFGQVEYIPTKRNITLTSKDLIFLPKWSIHFNSLGTIFSREVLAHSGTVIEDTIQYCPKHLSLGVVTNVLKTKPKTIAVCEECGKAFCADHIDQCPVCQKWVCKDHSSECSSCKIRFCKEHASHVCSNCKLPLCADCAVECNICKGISGKNHLQKCEMCGVTGCEKCVQKKATKGIVGLVKSARMCKQCFEKR